MFVIAAVRPKVAINLFFRIFRVALSICETTWVFPLMSSREFRHPHVMGQVMLLSRVASHELSLVSVPPKCGKCIRIWPAHQLAKDGCTNCRASTRQRQTSFKKTKGAKANFQQTLSLVMRSTLPEEIEKIYHHNLISDSTLTLPHIQLCLEDMMQVIESDLMRVVTPLGL